MIDEYKCKEDKVFTVSEAKGRENDFVVVYKLCTSKANEYERIFSDDFHIQELEEFFITSFMLVLQDVELTFYKLKTIPSLGLIRLML